MRTEAIDRLNGALLACRNDDGGWGYYAGRSSRLEPTAWALLGFAHDAAAGPVALDPLVDLFARWQRRDGLLACVPSAPPNLAFNGLAALALMHAARVQPSVVGIPRLLGRLVSGIAGVRGSLLPLSQRVLLWFNPSAKPSQQDDDLRGWPWVQDTFSWVEPTGWCLLALKRSRALTSAAPWADRIEEAERLLLDRCCLGGGWNYGNSNVLGKQLVPYVPTTAVGLLALQDRKGTPAVGQTIDFLVRNRMSEVSGMALSLALIALRACGLPADDVAEALAEDAMGAGMRGNNAARAMALCALTGESDEGSPFVV